MNTEKIQDLICFISHKESEEEDREKESRAERQGILTDHYRLDGDGCDGCDGCNGDGGN